MDSSRGAAWSRLHWIVTALLAALLIACSGIALAEDSEDTAAQDTASEEGVELPGQRTATSQTFSLPDGSRETRIFEAPVNYRDEGEWKPIEEGLEPAGGAALTNGENSFDVRLPARLGTGSVRMSMEDEWVSEQLLSEETESAELQDDDTASYEAADSGVSFDFATLGNGVKGNIELAGPSDPHVFRFALDASAGVTPELAEDGSVEFRDGDRVVATMPAPTISDSSGLESAPDAVHYALEHGEDGSWTLTVEADPEWLAQPDRAWPVTIDPSIVKAGSTLDCSIYNGAGAESNTCGFTGWPRIGTYGIYKSNEATDEYARSILRFETGGSPKLPTSRRRRSASMRPSPPKTRAERRCAA